MKYESLRFESYRWALLVISLLSLTAAFYDLRVATHEVLLRHPATTQIDQSIAVMPLDEAAFAKHAELNPNKEIADLQAVAQRNPWNTENSLRLSADLELNGQLKASESLLLAAASRDQGLGPRWALANFYLRNGKNERVFEIVNGYRRLNRQANPSLLRLSLDSSSSLGETVRRLPDLTCDELSDLLLLSDQRGLPSAELVQKQSACQDKHSRLSFASHVSHLLAGNQPSLASLQWKHAGMDDSLFNGEFKLPITEEGFDWRVNRTAGVTVSQPSNEGGLDLSISQEAASGSVLFFQPVLLKAESKYKFCITVANQKVAAAFLRAELVEMTTGRVILYGLDAVSDWQGDVGCWNFDPPQATQTLSIALVYLRPDRGVAIDREVEVKRAALQLGSGN
jgi:hypothetical protein